jgi:hypothetical protein
MAARDERLRDLFYLDQTSEGNPTEEGQARMVSGDIVAFLSGSVKSLTKATGTVDSILIDGSTSQALVDDATGNILVDQ